MLLLALPAALPLSFSFLLGVGVLFWLGVLNVFFAQRPHPRLVWWAGLPAPVAGPWTVDLWRSTLRYASGRWALGLLALLGAEARFPAHSAELLAGHAAFLFYVALVRWLTAQHLARLQAQPKPAAG